MVVHQLYKDWHDRQQRERDDARREGLVAVLTHQFERRLQRELTASERATLRARLVTLGPDRLGDVVLDLDTAALAAWLADADAR